MSDSLQNILTQLEEKKKPKEPKKPTLYGGYNYVVLPSLVGCDNNNASDSSSDGGGE